MALFVPFPLDYRPDHIKGKHLGWPGLKTAKSRIKTICPGQVSIGCMTRLKVAEVARVKDPVTVLSSQSLQRGAKPTVKKLGKGRSSRISRFPCHVPLSFNQNRPKQQSQGLTKVASAAPAPAAPATLKCATATASCHGRRHHAGPRQGPTRRRLANHLRPRWSAGREHSRADDGKDVKDVPTTHLRSRMPPTARLTADGARPTTGAVQRPEVKWRRPPRLTARTPAVGSQTLPDNFQGRFTFS